MGFIIGFFRNVGIFVFFVSLFLLIRYVYLWIKSLFKVNPLSLSMKEAEKQKNILYNQALDNYSLSISTTYLGGSRKERRAELFKKTK